MSYPFEEIEAKWQKWWEEQGTYRARQPEDTDAVKFYGLVEFPYPSGDGLHVGHPRSYTAIDIVTRKKRMEGRNVLYPMGWDAFGLPTENYAIKTKQPPAKVTAQNIANFKRQIMMLGVGFDWSREINTTDPEYYKWTQWMFIQFFDAWFDEKMGKARPINELVIPKEVEEQGEAAMRQYRDERRLAFKQKTTINWCPKDKIGLANEEAAGGVCDRCGGPVEKREKEQWMLRITAYAQRLIDELGQVDYLDKIKTSQINWIGRSEGALIRFQINPPTPLSQGGSNKVTKSPLVKGKAELSSRGNEGGFELTVFTTRPDTLFGATYMVLAPEHPLVTQWLEDKTVTNAKDVIAYQSKANKKSDLERQENKEKTGVQLKGVMAINPATKQEIPVWIADYVLAGYGTGAIMAVPAHDERDFEFAKKFDLPIIPVVLKADSESRSYVMGMSAEDVAAFDGTIVETTKDGFFKLKIPFEKLERYKNLIREKMQPGFWNEFSTGKGFYFIFKHKDGKLEEMELNEKTNDKIDEYGMTFNGQEARQQPKNVYVWLAENDFYKDLLIHSDGGTMINSDFLDGLETAKATEKMIAWLEKNKVGEKKVTYKLRDWVFSRQRYWGEPIPMIHCDHCGWVPMDESELPLLLPEVKDYEPTDTGESPLSSIKSFVAAKCPICQAKARRETDTMPNWAGSSWYFLRYCDPHNQEAFASAESLKYWMPVDLYNGGMEHTTLHLLYSRFWYKALYDLGFIPSACGNEPYKVRRSHAMILGEGGIKMSKSKGNVVNPDDAVKEYGADVLRTYEMFIGPYESDAPWSTRDIQGVRRFLDKVWTLAQAQINKAKSNIEYRISNVADGNMKSDIQRSGYSTFSEADIRTLSLPGIDAADVQPYDRILHQTIKKVGEDIDGLRFNTAVSQLMILTNELHGKDMRSRDFRSYLKLIAPFAPHLAEELWSRLGNSTSIHLEAWPNFDETKLVAESATIAIQVNGKLRGEIKTALGADESAVRQAAEDDPRVKKYLEGKKFKKVIFVKDKLISYVV